MRNCDLANMNNEVLSAWETAVNEIADLGGRTQAKRLRRCKAKVFETPHYIFLVSYSTVVAFIEKSTDTLYDVLRYVYGYTATSVKHVAKFDADYGTGKWGCTNKKTYRLD